MWYTNINTFGILAKQIDQNKVLNQKIKNYSLHRAKIYGPMNYNESIYFRVVMSNVVRNMIRVNMCHIRCQFQTRFISCMVADNLCCFLVLANLCYTSLCFSAMFSQIIVNGGINYAQIVCFLPIVDNCRCIFSSAHISTRRLAS